MISKLVGRFEVQALGSRTRVGLFEKWRDFGRLYMLGKVPSWKDKFVKSPTTIKAS